MNNKTAMQHKEVQQKLTFAVDSCINHARSISVRSEEKRGRLWGGRQTDKMESKVAS